MASTKTYRQLITEEVEKRPLVQAFRVRRRWLLRNKPDELITELFEQAQAENVIPADATLDDVPDEAKLGRDWASFFDALGKFLQVVLPIILKYL